MSFIFKAAGAMITSQNIFFHHTLEKTCSPTKLGGFIVT